MTYEFSFKFYTTLLLVSFDFLCVHYVIRFPENWFSFHTALRSDGGLLIGDLEVKMDEDEDEGVGGFIPFDLQRQGVNGVAFHVFSGPVAIWPA